MTEFFAGLGIDPSSFLTSVVVLLIGTLVLGLLGRFVFGRRSNFNSAVSSSIGILFIYAITVVLCSTAAVDARLIAPLPFVTISGDAMRIFSFAGSDYTAISAQLLSTVILAFLMNLADSWLPKGKRFFGWLFFRCLSIVIAYLLHLVVVGLFTTYLPEGIVTYAPVILLALLVLMLLTGVLKILVGALISTVNPIIGGLYTFFFATIVGKMISKAMLTTLILSLLVFALNYTGISVISIAVAALTAYIPFVLLVVVLWYVVHKFL